MSLAHGSCTLLPVRAASVDVLLCDLPFGKMFGSVDGNRELYPKMLAEAARAVRPGGRAVLLTSDSNGELMEAQVCGAVGPSQFLSLVSHFVVGYRKLMAALASAANLLYCFHGIHVHRFSYQTFY